MVVQCCPLLISNASVPHLLLEPLHGLVLGDQMVDSNAALLVTALANGEARASKNNIEVHSIDTDAWVILDSQIDVLLDTKSKVAGAGEGVLVQLVFLDLRSRVQCTNEIVSLTVFFSRNVHNVTHLQATLKNLLCLGTTDGAVDRDLLVTTDTERSHSVAGCKKDIMTISSYFTKQQATTNTNPWRKLAAVPSAIPTLWQRG